MKQILAIRIVSRFIKCTSVSSPNKGCFVIEQVEYNFFYCRLHNIQTYKMDAIGDVAQGQRLVNFRIFYLIAQMVGISIIILMGSWISICLGGFGWSTPAIEFNWHPMLMTIGMIYLFGNCKESLNIKLYPHVMCFLTFIIFSNYLVPWHAICQEKEFKIGSCINIWRYHGANTPGINCSLQFT